MERLTGRICHSTQLFVRFLLYVERYIYISIILFFGCLRTGSLSTAIFKVFFITHTVFLLAMETRFWNCPKCDWCRKFCLLKTLFIQSVQFCRNYIITFRSSTCDPSYTKNISALVAVYPRSLRAWRKKRTSPDYLKTRRNCIETLDFSFSIHILTLQ